MASLFKIFLKKPLLKICLKSCEMPERIINTSTVRIPTCLTFNEANNIFLNVNAKPVSHVPNLHEIPESLISSYCTLGDP